MTILSLKGHSRGLGLSPRRRATADGGGGPPGDTEAPSVPQNLSATAVSDDQIDLTWDASSDNVGVTGYNIYRDNLLIDTSPTNSYADTGLASETLYEYEVSAFDAAANESARSGPDSATTAASGDTEAPSVPQNLSATAVSDDQIDLTWDASSDNVGVTGYNIYRDDVLVDTSPTNAYSDTGLDPATEYDYEVSAFDAASNESARSAPDSATTHQVIVQAGLVAEWRFDEGAGQVLTDHTGNGHHGQLGSTSGADTNDPAWSAQGLVFTAADQDIVGCDTVGISGGAARTVLAAIRTDGSTNFGVEWVGSGPNFTRYTLRNSGGNLRLEVAGAGFTSSLGLSPGSWHFVGVTQSGSNLNTAVLYRDGGSQAVTLSQVIDTQGNFQFGKFGSLFGSMTGAYCLVYDRALSAPEVAQNRQALATFLAARGITLP